MNCPFLHMELARKLGHPFNDLQSLKHDHLRALREVERTEDRANLQRLRVLAEWRQLSKSLEVSALQDQHEKLASGTAKKLGRKPRTALLELLGKRYGIADEAVPCLLLTGMPIVGVALESPFFESYEVPPQISVYELLATARKRRPETIRRVQYMAEKGSAALAKAIYEKTLKEVYKGSMGGPFTEEDLIARHGPHYNLIPAFGLEQGLSELGEVKYRRIDDHTAGHTNLAAGRQQKINMAMTDYLVTMVKAFFDRQIPLTDRQVSISITGVWNPVKQKVEQFELYGQPFGAAHAVPNFYRVAEYMSVLLTRSFHVMIDHFFDDYFYIDRIGSAKTSMFCIQQAFQLTGLHLDPDKSQPPAEVSHILGVQFNSAALASERLLSVEPKPTRQRNFSLLVDRILEQQLLPPSVAASVVGKFGFLCSTLFGKVGRFCTGFLRERQYDSSSSSHLTPDLILSLKLMVHIVHIAPHRTCSMASSTPPTIIYTDASDVPDRDPRYGLGGVLIVQHPHLRIEYFSASPPIDIVTAWASRHTYMGQLELLACPVALLTWKSSLQKSQILHFIDNDSAAAGLVRGYSPTTDSSPIIGRCWVTAAEFGMDIYIDRVESKSNLSDGPSRFDFSDMVALKAVQVSPVFPTTVSPLFIS